MFEHLDDPEPYAPAPGLQSLVEGRGRRRRRKRIAVAGGVASVAALGVGSVVAVRARLEPQRIEVEGLTTQPDEVVVEPGDPITFLVVGTDGRVGVEGSRADTIGLVRVDPGADELRLLTVPRDLVLEVDDGIAGRAAQVFRDRGPEGLVQGVQRTLGVEVHHYVQVDFPGAVELVDALGGVRVALDRGYRDADSGLAPLAAGCHELDGATTLALGRSRKGDVQQDDGGWAPDHGAVFGRDARGAAIAAALIQTVGRAGAAELPGLVETGLGSIAVDGDLGTEDLVDWVRDARDDRFVPFGLPTVESPPEAPAVLVLQQDAPAVVAAFLDGGSDPVPAAVDGDPLPEATGLRPC